MESPVNGEYSHKILVIGASSYVGARLYVDLKNAGLAILGTHNQTELFSENVRLDITDRAQVDVLFSNFRPNIVVLVAAFSNQASVDHNPSKAEEVNIRGCEYVSIAAKSWGAPLVYISTEAVFHQTGYGELKRRAEEIVKENSISYLILRLGMCFGGSPNKVNDRPHNRLIRALEKREPISFDSSLKFYPTYLPHLSAVLIELIKYEHWKDTIAVICSEPTNRYEIAKLVLQNIQVNEVKTENVPPLPPLSDMDLKRLGLPTLHTSKMLQLLRDELQVS